MIDIVTLEDHWTDNAQVIAQKIYALLIAETFIETGEVIALALSDNAHLQSLNKQFRQIDKPTNVLSFESETEGFLGDIAIAHETIVAEAIEQDKSFDDHFTHIALHGMLHLLGYDHMSEDDQSEMEALEIELLAKLGIENPYE
jgi:probable rRNA maturation factor